MSWPERVKQDKPVGVPRYEQPVSSTRFDLAVIRWLDVSLAGLGLLFLLPLMIVLIIVTWLGDPGPVFFGHVRIGKGGRAFHCLKFRTMVADAEERLLRLLQSDPDARAEWERDRKLTNDPRITGIGRFMRKTSLDELPQLWNVVRGEMSLIGPRPIVQAEVPRYGRYIADYMSTRPGISGLWQISGRNNVSYRRRVALDVAFARSRSLKLYLRILVLTLPAVILQRGSY
ncbi:sugar transferase [Sphingomonas sp. UYP23]